MSRWLRGSLTFPPVGHRAGAGTRLRRCDPGGDPGRVAAGDGAQTLGRGSSGSLRLLRVRRLADLLPQRAGTDRRKGGGGLSQEGGIDRFTIFLFFNLLLG